MWTELWQCKISLYLDHEWIPKKQQFSDKCLMDKACPLNQFQGQLKKLKRINAYREFISMMWSLDLINDSGHIHHKYINENKRIESEIIILDQRFADRYSWSFVIVGIYDTLFNFV